LKIVIATVQVPFISGGAEILVKTLRNELVKRNFEVDIVTIPFKWYPPQTIVDCMRMARMVDISEINGENIDLVIAMKFPAYYIKHKNKVIWLLHQHRQAYDLWGTPFGDLNTMKFGKEVRDLIFQCDNALIPKAKKIFTISDIVTKRLLKYNNINATTLYPPAELTEKFHCRSFENFIFCPGRIDAIKRQTLLIEALKYCSTPIKIIFAGGSELNEINNIKSILSRDNTSDSVEFRGFITNEEKIDLYSRCLAVYFGPYQEDYGYITIEAFLSEKPVITHTDSGGPLEFVNESNGFVINPKPKEIAQIIDKLFNNKELAKNLGQKGRELMETLNINWDFVIRELLG
jgi:glycosyltransferase involved in cell wall biosynthesis